MKKVLDKKFIFLFSIIILLSVRLIFVYSERTSYYTDELTSYGVSNSIGNPVLVWYETYDNSDNTIKGRYCGDWYDGDILNNYLIINPEERFHFLDVIKNKAWDTAPPNFELLIHFVSSLFPGTFSFGYAFSINFIFYIGSLLLVFFIARNIFKEENTGWFNALCCTVFWGLSICGTGAFTFLRMYGILSFYSLLMIYSIQRIFLKDKIRLLDHIILFISFFLGLFTHTLFIIFAFWLTLFSCLCLFIKKRFADSIKTGFTVFTSLIIFLLIYPFDYSRVNSWMNTENNYGYSFFTNLSFANKYSFTQSIGLYIPFSVANIIWWIGIVLFIFITLTLFCFLFRKEKWIIPIKDKSVKYIKMSIHTIYDSLNQMSPLITVIFLTSLAYMLTATAVSPIVTQGIYSTRYLFLCMNPFIICFISILSSQCRSFKRQANKVFKTILIVLYMCLILYQNIVLQNPFKFSNTDNYMYLHDLVQDTDTAVFGTKRWVLNSMILPLKDVKSFYFDVISEDKINEFKTPEKDFYIVIDKSLFRGDSVAINYSNVIDNVENSDDFVAYILAEKYEDYSIEHISEIQINRLPFDVYYLKLKK